MIIGISGLKGSGKDTIAAHMVNEFGFERYSFADPIKNACRHLFGFTDEQLWGSEKEVKDVFWGVTPRQVLQVMGTELFQFDLIKHIPELGSIGRSFWVKVFERWYENNSEKNIVIPDVRFHHEVEILRKLGAIIWKVERGSVEDTDPHPSEVELRKMNDFDYTFINNGTIEELNKEVGAIFYLFLTYSPQ